MRTSSFVARHRAVWTAAGSAVAVAAFVGGCGGEARTPAGAPAEKGSAPEAAQKHVGGGTVTVRLPVDWGGSLLPYMLSFSRDSQLITAAYDTLLVLDTEAEIKPYVAKSWEAEPSSVTFTLRDDVKCADGTPMTATVVQKSLETALNAEGSALKIFAGNGPFTVTGDDAANTVKVTTEAPNNDLVAAFTAPQSGLVCPAGLEKGADTAKQTFGSGPYVAQDVVLAKSVTMTKNPAWAWGPFGETSETMADEIKFELIESDAAAANLLATGGLDAGWVAGTEVDRLSKESSLQKFVSPGVSPHHVIFNNSIEPFKTNGKLREALLTALDREQIMNAELGPGGGKLATSVLGEKTSCYIDISSEIPSQDPEKAKQLLREAGYTEQGGKWVKAGKPLEINLIGSEILQRSAPELIMEQLKAIGVTVKLTSKPTSAYSADLLAGKFDMAIYESGTVTPSPSTLTKYLVGKPFGEGGSNLPRTQDPKADELAAKAQAAELEDRCPIWEEFQHYYVGQQHYLMPLGVAVGTVFTRGYDVITYLDRLLTPSLQKRAD